MHSSERFQSKQTQETSSLPRVPIEDILSLPEEELAIFAQKLGTTPEALKPLLEKTAREKEENKMAPMQRPESRDEYAEKMDTALSEAVREYDAFSLGEYTPERLFDYERELHDIYGKIGDRPLSSLGSKEKQKIIELYRKIHIAKAMSFLGITLTEYTEEDKKPGFYKLWAFLYSAAEKSNDSLEKIALSDVIKLFRNVVYRGDFENSLLFTAAYLSGDPLTEQQRKDKFYILSKARSMAMSGVMPPTDRYGNIIESVARQLKEMGIWGTEYGGVSGPSEVFDMPGDRGIGGQVNYPKGPRPHRDDYGSSGGRDDK